MKTQAAIDHILNVLRSELHAGLRYHSIEHTLSVMDNIEVICQVEPVSDSEKSLLRTAAAYHDCGFIRSYMDHEIHGCHVARETLPSFGYSDAEITLIEQLIMETKIPQQPSDHLSRILCDADLFYLGGDDYEVISFQLYEEIRLNVSALSEKKWLALQIEFLEAHNFWTDYAKFTCNPQKEVHLSSLRKIAEEL